MTCTAYFELTYRWADEWPVLSRTVFGTTDGIVTRRPGDAVLAVTGRRKRKLAAVQVTFDPGRVTYEQLLEIFYLESRNFTRSPDLRHPLLGSSPLVFSDDEQVQTEAVRDRLFDEVHQSGSAGAGSTPWPPAAQRWPVVRISRFDVDPSFAVADSNSAPLDGAELEADRTSHDQALNDLRALMAEAGGCFDDSPDGPNATHPPFADQIDGIFVYDPQLLRRLTETLQEWLDEPRSIGLADWQHDVRAVMLANDIVTATSFVRVSRTHAAFRFESNLRPGNTTLREHWTYGARRVFTDLDASGQPTETIEPIYAGRSPIMAKAAPWEPASHVDPDAVGTWHEHIPPVDLPCACDPTGEAHVVRWRAGRIELGCTEGTDNTLERTLFMLGNNTCYCLMLRDLWNPRLMLRRCMGVPIDDMFYPVSWRIGVRSVPRPLGPEGKLRLPTGPPPPQVAFVNEPIDKPIGRPTSIAAQQLLMDRVYLPIERQGLAFYTRWLLTNLAWMTEHYDQLGPDDRTDYATLVFQHAEPPLLEALWTPGRANQRIKAAAINLHLRGPDQPAVITGSVEDDLVRIDAGFSFHWITRVWVRGLSIASGQLVLDATGPADAKELNVVVAGWEQAEDLASGAALVTRDGRARRYKTGWRLV